MPCVRDLPGGGCECAACVELRRRVCVLHIHDISGVRRALTHRGDQLEFADYGRLPSTQWQVASPLVAGKRVVELDYLDPVLLRAIAVYNRHSVQRQVVASVSALTNVMGVSRDMESLGLAMGDTVEYLYRLHHEPTEAGAPLDPANSFVQCARELVHTMAYHMAPFFEVEDDEDSGGKRREVLRQRVLVVQEMACFKAGSVAFELLQPVVTRGWVEDAQVYGSAILWAYEVFYQVLHPPAGVVGGL